MDPRSNPRSAAARQHHAGPRRSIRPPPTWSQLYPAPNLPGQINNFLYNPVQTNRVDQLNIRTDYRTSKSAIFGRFS